MVKPTHMYIVHDEQQKTLRVHYGKLKPIMEYIPDELGGTKVHFKHPERGFVYSFKSAGEPEAHLVDEKSAQQVRNQIKNQARKRNIKIVKPDEVYSETELFFCKVEMGMGRTSIPPAGFYTTDLGACIGISLYNPNSQYTHLFHTPGCDDDRMPTIVRYLEDRLTEQNSTDLSAMQVNIASGLFTLGDDEVEAIIRKARNKLVEFFFSKDIDPKTHFAEQRGEVITFMSIEPHRGLVDIVKKHLAY